jgi:hypothetical protein
MAFMVLKIGRFESRSVTPGTFLYMVLEKGGELLEWWYEELRITKSQRGGISYIQ